MLLLCGGVAACHRYVLSATQHSEQYTHPNYDMLPHHRITYNDVVFSNFNLNQT